MATSFGGLAASTISISPHSRLWGGLFSACTGRARACAKFSARRGGRDVRSCGRDKAGARVQRCTCFYTRPQSQTVAVLPVALVHVLGHASVRTANVHPAKKAAVPVVLPDVINVARVVCAKENRQRNAAVAPNLQFGLSSACGA
ncbi:hypothetical protein NDU88_003510 [Pleurodeles waltl]|uniref:Uncharacterized protein n=1 Tax=Pleurodeles waltl TaxID=8319 RepID=A0AAV7KV30_PLEWA|nr:hypothetical protein NDU88_003510 [Pleurodeles waltl]